VQDYLANSPDIEDKLSLSAEALQEAQEAVNSVQADFLAENRLNVVGMGVGNKITAGQATQEPAVMVLVTAKMPNVSPADRVPDTLAEHPTDVVAVGELLALGYAPVVESYAPMASDPQTLARRIRPAEGGYSVGHINVTAGTIATCVYDILPGGSTNPPAHGVGVPPRYYILSNNHVLANSNAAAPGDPILQPGRFDGGVDPADRIARLSRFVPIRLTPAVPLEQHNNLVDCAVAEGAFHDLDREIYWIGYVRGWRRKADVKVGTIVQKTGRTTHYTTGRITTINATVDIGGFPGGGVGRFVDQIVTTNMSAGGDSGSLVTTLDKVAVGLLFAGSSVATIVNQIENVRSLLRVEVAEQIL
jgi:hypothetical protein